MIYSIRGELVEKEPTRAVVEAAGVGYELLIPLSTYERLPKTGAQVKLLTFHSVREDDELLFGFASAAEKDLFAKLTAVGGVGPKMAIAILSGGSVGELCLAIAGGNAKRISSIKGVGKKTAEKILIELKDKVNAIAALSSTQRAAGRDGAAPILRDAILALSALGFGEDVARAKVQAVLEEDPGLSDVEAVLKKALSK